MDVNKDFQGIITCIQFNQLFRVCNNNFGPIWFSWLTFQSLQDESMLGRGEEERRNLLQEEENDIILLILARTGKKKKALQFE